MAIYLYSQLCSLWSIGHPRKSILLAMIKVLQIAQLPSNQSFEVTCCSWLPSPKINVDLGVPWVDWCWLNIVGGHKLWSSQIKSYLKLLNSSWDPASIKPLPLARQSACGCLTSAQGFLCCGMWEAVKKQHLWISKEKTAIACTSRRIGLRIQNSLQTL